VGGSFFRVYSLNCLITSRGLFHLWAYLDRAPSLLQPFSSASTWSSAAFSICRLLPGRVLLCLHPPALKCGILFTLNAALPVLHVFSITHSQLLRPLVGSPVICRRPGFHSVCRPCLRWTAVFLSIPSDVIFIRYYLFFISVPPVHSS
jgi:hypothetical protein